MKSQTNQKEDSLEKNQSTDSTGGRLSVSFNP